MKRALPASLVVGLLTLGAARAANPVVVMETSMGTIKLELFEDKAPITVANFLSYVDDKHYDNTIFHRVIDGYVIQGGGFGTDKKEKPTKETIKNEWTANLPNKRGTLALARKGEASSGAAQFFINVVDNAGLDRARPETGNAGYCVFGKVIEGIEVADKIKGVATNTSELESSLNGKIVRQPSRNVPVENVVIKSIRREGK